MKVATDNNIFMLQKFGGISRLFQDYIDNGLIQEKLMLPYNDLYLTKNKNFINKIIKQGSHSKFPIILLFL